MEIYPHIHDQIGKYQKKRLMRRQHFPSNSHAPSAGNTNKNSSTIIIGEKTLNFATAGTRSPVSIDKSPIVKNY
jgi:hypothetical protein